MNNSNWIANDIFSQTEKLAIVPCPIGGLGHKTTLPVAADEALK
jgi:hypothetical protein